MKSKALIQKLRKAVKTKARSAGAAGQTRDGPKLAERRKTKLKTWRKSHLTKSRQKRPSSKISAKARKKRPPTREPFPHADQLKNRYQSFAALFSSSWGFFAWELYQANDTATVKEIFCRLNAQGFDSYLTDFRYDREIPATPKTLRKAHKDLHSRDLRVRAAGKEHEQAKAAVREAEEALQLASGKQRRKVSAKLKARRAREEQAQRNYQEAVKQIDEIYEAIMQQRAYIARNEILKFTGSKRRSYTPENLAMAVAGLPHVSWRQSAARCKKFERPPVQSHYRIFEAVRSAFRRGCAPFRQDFVGKMIAMVTENPDVKRLLEMGPNRTALRRACEEFAAAEISKVELQYRIAAAFTRNLRSSLSPLERVLESTE